MESLTSIQKYVVNVICLFFMFDCFKTSCCWLLMFVPCRAVDDIQSSAPNKKEMAYCNMKQIYSQ
uniref:Uncharacterized protein n=1 Tax=Octopus bimaculoides TaxID=37653 RepID=A0A0L8HYD9_OCTBM